MKRLLYESPLTFQQMLFTARTAKASSNREDSIAKSALFLKTELEHRLENQLQILSFFPSKPQVLSRLMRPMEQTRMELKNIPSTTNQVDNITSILQKYRVISTQSTEDTLSGLKDMVEAKARTATTNYEERMRNLEQYLSTSEMLDLNNLLDSLLFSNFAIQLMIDQHNYICSLRNESSTESEGKKVLMNK